MGSKGTLITPMSIWATTHHHPLLDVNPVEYLITPLSLLLAFPADDINIAGSS